MALTISSRRSQGRGMDPEGFTQSLPQVPQVRATGQGAQDLELVRNGGDMAEAPRGHQPSMPVLSGSAPNPSQQRGYAQLDAPDAQSMEMAQKGAQNAMGMAAAQSANAMKPEPEVGERFLDEVVTGMLDPSNNPTIKAALLAGRGLSDQEGRLKQ